jgi:hypothetical protein
MEGVRDSLIASVESEERVELEAKKVNKYRLKLKGM